MFPTVGQCTAVQSVLAVLVRFSLPLVPVCTLYVVFSVNSSGNPACLFLNLLLLLKHLITQILCQGSITYLLQINTKKNKINNFTLWDGNFNTNYCYITAFIQYTDMCNKGCGMCYPVCGMVHIKEPLLLIVNSNLCGGSRFPFSLSEWSLTICLTPYNRKCVECVVK